MKKYIVNTVFANQEEGKIEKFFYNAYTDYNKAREVAFDLSQGIPHGWSTEVGESDEQSLSTKKFFEKVIKNS